MERAPRGEIGDFAAGTPKEGNNGGLRHIKTEDDPEEDQPRLWEEYQGPTSGIIESDCVRAGCPDTAVAS